VNGTLQNVMKTIRGSQPFNFVATGTVRAFFRATGFRSEKVIKHLHRVGHVRSRLPNGRPLRLWSRGDDWISNQVYWRGWSGYEPETVPLFFELASHAQVTLDIGAHVGFFTLLAAHANPNGRVFSFEPMAAIHQRLRQNVALNRLDNVECIEGAVGETDGHAEFFHVGESLPSSSSLSREFMTAGGGKLHSTRVPVTTIDKFIHEKRIGRVDLLKVDTESTEPQVLRGMVNILARDRPSIICEVLKGRGSEDALQDILRPFGYRFYLLTPNGPQLRERIQGHPDCLNYLFVTGKSEAIRPTFSFPKPASVSG
jgi:FkbM family methyltransferase